MAYFNHAFRKCFLVDSVDTVADETTSSLAASELAIVDGSTWLTVATAGDVAAGAQSFLVVGSLHATDTIGNNPGHGGYSESVKTKGIMPKYITKAWKSVVCTPEAATASLSLASDCVPCGSSIFVRIDVKGSPALRFLNHNAYAIGDSANVCCVDGQEYIDPASALAEAGSQLLADPLISPFVAEGSSGNVATLTVDTPGSGYPSSTTTTNVATTGGSGSGLKVDITTTGTALQSAVINANNGGKGYKVGDVVDVDGGTGKLAVATVAPGGVIVETTAVPFTSFTIAQIQDGTYTPSTDPVGDGVSATISFVGAYVETKFGNCSFDTRDFYGKEPVQIILSNLDETGEPCNDCGVASRTTGTMPQTQGETVLRDLLMSERYMQMPYNQGNRDSARIREIEHSDDVVDAVDRNALYVAFNILHSVPRFNNPTGTFDNDQYLYTFYVKSTSPNLAAIETHLETLLALNADVAAFDETDACGDPCTIS